MLGLTLRQAKANFLDRAKVTQALDAVKREKLAQQGAYVQTTMQRLMRYRKKPSLPGEPPSAHPTWTEEIPGTDGKVKKKKRGALLREFLYFAWDAAKQTVVVGPIKLGRSEAPSALEFGTSIHRRNPRRRVRKVGSAGEIRIDEGKPVYARLETASQAERANLLNAALYGPDFISGTLKPRPFRQPALDKARPGLARIWRDALKRR